MFCSLPGGDEQVLLLLSRTSRRRLDLTQEPQARSLQGLGRASRGVDQWEASRAQGGLWSAERRAHGDIAPGGSRRAVEPLAWAA
jgi:hypothetical protein